MSDTSPERRALVQFEHGIADELMSCAKVFRNLLFILHSKQQICEDEVPHREWCREFERLRTWSANIGAHQHGTASLDFRLRDASHIANQVLALLRSLRELLNDVLTLLPKTSASDIEPDSKASDFSLDDVDADDTSEHREVFEAVVLRINCLFEMSLAIRKPANLDRISGVRKQLHGSFQQDDLRRIKDLFPKADPQLQKNLAAANTVRRGVLKHYDQRQQNYARGVSSTFDDTASQAGMALSTFAATEYAGNKSLNDDNRSVSASSNRSLSSLMDESRSFYIPIPKELHSKRPFPCPYCHYLLDTYERQTYVRHVLEDITPYQCIYPGCVHEQELLASRSTWAQHLQSAHLKSHDTGVTEPCQLCGFTTPQYETFETHIVRHLEDIALDVINTSDPEHTEAETEFERVEELDSLPFASVLDDIDIEMPNVHQRTASHKDNEQISQKIREAVYVPLPPKLEKDDIQSHNSLEATEELAQSYPQAAKTGKSKRQSAFAPVPFKIRERKPRKLQEAGIGPNVFLEALDMAEFAEKARQAAEIEESKRQAAEEEIQWLRERMRKLTLQVDAAKTRAAMVEREAAKIRDSQIRAAKGRLDLLEQRREIQVSRRQLPSRPLARRPSLPVSAYTTVNAEPVDTGQAALDQIRQESRSHEDADTEPYIVTKGHGGQNRRSHRGEDVWRFARQGTGSTDERK